MSTNDSTPDPTAGERPCDGRSTNVCVAEGCYGEACLRYPAPTANAASTPASEGLTVDEREALGDWWESDWPDTKGGAIGSLYAVVAQIKADAETKARADERERIAQAIEADGPPADYPGGTVAGRAYARAARIARSDA